MPFIQILYLNFQLESHEHDPGVVVVLDELRIFETRPQSFLLLKMLHKILQMLKQRSEIFVNQLNIRFPNCPLIEILIF